MKETMVYKDKKMEYFKTNKRKIWKKKFELFADQDTICIEI